MQFTVRPCNMVGRFLLIEVYMPVHAVDASSVLMALQKPKFNSAM